MATVFAVSTVIIVLTPLVAIFGYLVFKGIGSVNWAFLTQTPKPPGELGGGMANAIAGSVLILAIGSLMGVPLGIGAGIYLLFGGVVVYTRSRAAGCTGPEARNTRRQGHERHQVAADDWQLSDVLILQRQLGAAVGCIHDRGLCTDHYRFAGRTDFQGNRNVEVLFG